MPTPHINKKGHPSQIFYIYHRSFKIAISPRDLWNYTFETITPGGDSYCEASMIDIKNSSWVALIIDFRSRHVVFWPKILYSYCCGLHRVDNFSQKSSKIDAKIIEVIFPVL